MRLRALTGLERSKRLKQNLAELQKKIEEYRAILLIRTSFLQLLRQNITYKYGDVEELG